MKINTFNILNYKYLRPFAYILLLIFIGCTKQQSISNSNADSYISFNVNQIDITLEKNASLNIKNGLANTNSEANILFTEIFDLNGTDVKITVEESDFQNTNKVHPYRVESKIASTKLQTGFKYRLILYEAGTNTVVSNTLGTAGTRLDVPVEKGNSYDWVCLSFNDTNDPGTSVTTLNTDNRDLLYAKSSTAVSIPVSTGVGQNINVPINIMLKHLLSQITVEVNSENFPGNISSLAASFGANNYFQSGTLDIKSGIITNPTPINTTSLIPFEGIGSPIASKSFYTVGSTTINPFQVIVNSLVINSGGNNVTLPSAKGYNFTNITPTPGKSIKAKIEYLSIADFTCYGSPSVSGDYTVETPLTSSNKIDVPLNVIKAGRVHLISKDKNGMFFDSGIITLNAGMQTVTLLPNNSTSVLNELDGINAVPSNESRPSKPNTAEENNDTSNDQSDTYIITNAFTENAICSPVRIQVRAKVISSSALNLSNSTTPPYWPANNSIYASDGNYKDIIPKDKRIQMDMANLANWSALYPMLWYVYVKNVSGVNIPWTKFDAVGSADQRFFGYSGDTHYHRKKGDPIAPNARYGSLDPYLNAASTDNDTHPIPTANSSTYGAHGAGYGGIPGFYAELTDVGFTLRLNGLYYKYRLHWNSKQISTFNYSCVPTMVLYGIIKTELDEKDIIPFAPTASYTPSGADNGDRNYLSYNP